MGLRNGLRRRAKNAIGKIRDKVVGAEPSVRSQAQAGAAERAASQVQPEAIEPDPPAPVAADPLPTDQATAPEPGGLREKLSQAMGDGSLDEEEAKAIEERVVEAIKTIFDPEIPVNIYELGLIYGVTVQPDRNIAIKMTLTSPNCPAAQSLPSEVQTKAEAVEGALGATIDIVWDPPWTPERMSEAAQLELNLI